MFKKVLVANRGEIACRIFKTLKKLHVNAIAIFSDADAHAAHVRAADEAYRIGSAPATESYLQIDRILSAARLAGAEAIHPGYGFLSENADFAEKCEKAGLIFIGPKPNQIRAFGLKHTARELASKAGVPLLPGSDLLPDAATAAAWASEIGYPVMLKSTAGGGGIGLQLCRTEGELLDRFLIVTHQAETNFKQAGVYLEKFVEAARHIEVQIFGNGKGEVIALGERDCSTQRRNQKVIEETPATGVTEETRQHLFDAATKLGKSVDYQSAGTVEFIFDVAENKFYFLEVNSRLQVEHGVTEEVTGIDLVEWMICLAAGDPPELTAPRPNGHSLQGRIYAEDPNKNFQPSSGLITEAVFPTNARVDTWIETGTEVSPFYDPLLAKIVVKGANRTDALEKLGDALVKTRIEGIETNQAYLSAILHSEIFVDGKVTTRFLRDFSFEPQTIDVLESGTQTSIQDFPGRIGYWSVGVPPSGPMDALAFRLGNAALDNAPQLAGLEMTMSGPTLQFNTSCQFCLTGAPMKATLDNAAVPFWTVIQAHRGQTLRIGKLERFGARAYLTVSGGFQTPIYLGSRSTFALGGFGGHGGRVLRVGDVLRIAPKQNQSRFSSLPDTFIPEYSDHWVLKVILGPHSAPDFFTEEDIEAFFAAEWKVHYNSNRTGVRLIGPKPKWARKDGGEAGLHPSNIHDNAYAVAAVDFTGDMPIILGPDGPSLGGFVCPAVLARAETWKLGQLKAGDIVRFQQIGIEEAVHLGSLQDRMINTLEPPVNESESGTIYQSDPKIDCEPASDARPEVVYRLSGDTYLLVEYGPITLDLNLRFRVHVLSRWLEDRAIPGIIDLTPGIRSLQIHYDIHRLPLRTLMGFLRQAETELSNIDEITVPTRILHLPLSWEDDSTLLAIQKYMQSVRADAPWCPSNLEFIRRINGLGTIQEVRDIVFAASYLVLGLGDVYLGAPVATPIDPRHRLVTTKYNPARTWTPENAVGIGGAYLCIYGMEGPGGYQFVGRTVQVWNRFKSTPAFSRPWLLRFFDQIRFYPVTQGELLRNRDDFLHGMFNIRIEDQTFSLRDYNNFLRSISAEATAFKAKQQAAFEAERERWAATEFVAAPDLEPVSQEEIALPENSYFVDSAIAGNLWKILVDEGALVQADQPIAIVESMKTEMQVCAPAAGEILRVIGKEATPVSPGQHLFIIR